MSTELAEATEDAIRWQETKELRETVRRAVFPKSTDAEMSLYLHDCRRAGVHPLDRLIHPQVRGSGDSRRYTAVTSIDLFRARAAQTGVHAGTSDASFAIDAQGAPVSATVTVRRFVQGKPCNFTATARWSEYVPNPPGDMMWKKMPHTMLAKCAEALALRKAFPAQLGGFYSSDEMEQAPAPLPQPDVEGTQDLRDAIVDRARALGWTSFSQIALVVKSVTGRVVTTPDEFAALGVDNLAAIMRAMPAEPDDSAGGLGDA